MQSWANNNEFFTSYLQKMRTAWWIEIVTEQPKFTYYFGPFASVAEARISQVDYIKDLEADAQVIDVTIKSGWPSELRIPENELRQSLESQRPSAISGFVKAWLG